eukprot:TRINITY_DN2564_c0_g1_i1.p1 TRINITY_DN2564_c0_g1~~TRINITY_DN2564_c0_g1_i1.p1  ORF type:complete len:713 (+),score=202.72 TRINITY_DN2564_c0_g1_i1:37-2139(+)
MKRSELEQLVENLKERIEKETPESGTSILSLPIRRKDVDEDDIPQTQPIKFSQLPISPFTLKGLKEENYKKLTDVQKATIPYSLSGKDVIASAKTGTGKTLSYLIPLVERLFRQRWTREDGLGGIVITPNRELALQVFYEIDAVAKYHDFSCGLITGGKSHLEEAQRIHSMNILIATPGRLLHHLDETYGFSVDNLQMLVIDEADQCFDMGFMPTLLAIMDHLPVQRQTLLFSATLSKGIHQFAKLGFNNPEYIPVHGDLKVETPQGLVQRFMVVSAEEKLNVLFSFIKMHLNTKVIVFLASVKQVRFVFEAFCQLRPGIPLSHIHGTMKQGKRNHMYEKFRSDKRGVLFCTDVAARGLDFDDVEWVVQVDCPGSTDDYIHRVGRTARLYGDGKALLFLEPFELDFHRKLRDLNIPLKSTEINRHRLLDISEVLQALIFQNTEMKEMAQKAIVSYFRSVGLRPIYSDTTQLNLKALAKSYGLLKAPKVAGAMKVINKRGTARNWATDEEENERGMIESKIAFAENSSEKAEKTDVESYERGTRIAKMLKPIVQAKSSQLQVNSGFDDDSDEENESEEELFEVKKMDYALESDVKEKLSRKERSRRKKVVDDQKVFNSYLREIQERKDQVESQLIMSDIHDKHSHRNRIREQRFAMEDTKKEPEITGNSGVVLQPYDSDDDVDDEKYGSDSSDDDGSDSEN